MNEIKTLEEYSQIAKKILKIFIKKTGFVPREYNEIIGNLIFVLVKSDQSYDKSFNKTLKTYSAVNCIRYLKNYVRKSCSRRYFCSDFSDFDPPAKVNSMPTPDYNGYVNYLINNSGLTQLQKEHVNFFRAGLRNKEIAAHYKTSVENVHQTLKESIKKMKILTGVKNESTI